MPLPTNFTILTRPREEIVKVEKTTFGLEVLMDFPSAWRALGSKWMDSPERLKEGELQLLSEEGEFRHFKVWIKYEKKGIAAKEYSLEKAEFQVWQHKNGFSLIINAPRILAELSACLLSVAIYKDPFAIRVHKIRKEDFLTLISYVKSLGGKVVVLHLRGINTEDMGNLSVFKVSGKDLEKSQDIDRFLEVAKKVTRIGFQIPNLGGTEFRFWLGHWGGGTIYLPSMTEPHHVWNLIRFFEKAFKE